MYTKSDTNVGRGKRKEKEGREAPKQKVLLVTEEMSQVSNSLLKLIKRLIKLINNIMKSLLERLTKLLKALIYVVCVCAY